MLRSTPVAVAALLLACSLAAAEPLPAFPGAEGPGAFATGGRGGRVIFVTNLDDYKRGREPIEGSFRAACEAKGPRIIVFRVGGTIQLVDKFRIEEPNVTIAGQTAPGGGICIAHHGLSVRGDNAIIRHVRFRPGDVSGSAEDGLEVYLAKNVIVDHCSVSWATDETLSVTGDGCTNVTIQYCLISESLNRSVHEKGAHGYGSLVRTNGEVTYHHNIYAHHSSRCPRPGTYGEGCITFDFRNNVVYHGKAYTAEDPVRMNYVGNYIRRPSKPVFRVGGAATYIFEQGTVVENRPELRGWAIFADIEPGNMLHEPLPTAAVTTHTAEEAYRLLLADCGATLPQRDAVDARVIEQVRSGTGELINSQAQVGGWPELATGEPPADTDNDGLPDAWEKANGLNPNDPADANADADDDGYTNIEEWLNGE